MSGCLVWRSSVPPQRKQFSSAQLAVTEYKGHLQLKHSTAEWHIKTMVLSPMYSSQVQNSFMGIWRY